ncbi:DUF6597 domain-containing transcriptional factor [Zobellia russellii]|uniref:DUF6597 domain-containing transcriptional factor n=1 Tax=Zobellia russellii TaxID=248907 RepID=UPI0037DC034D
MIYFQEQPNQNLKDYVRCYWKIENKNKDFQYYTIFPDGFFDLLICYHNNNLEDVFLSGLWNQKTSVFIAPETTIYGVQFRLLAIENIIRENISEILNNIISIEKSYTHLNELSIKRDSNVFEHFNQYLLSCIEKQSCIDPRKEHLLKAINQTKGNNTVQYYSEKANWSDRQINRYFQSTFGLSLKAYCNIRKGASNFSQIKKGELYAQEGYFDQPHFIKGIKKITGFTPKVLLKNENDRFLQFSIIKNE